jgi:hypothetical protein
MERLFEIYSRSVEKLDSDSGVWPHLSVTPVCFHHQDHKVRQGGSSDVKSIPNPSASKKAEKADDV